MQQDNSSRRTMMKYAGMATTWLVTLGVAVFLGYKADQWLDWKFPVFTVTLPLVAIISLLRQIIKDFSKPK
jgi:uncharacterized membrane protein YhiD involved in acid resistance